MERRRGRPRQGLAAPRTKETASLTRWDCGILASSEISDWGDNMPQLVKGGKYVFGWSRVGATGRVLIPPEAVEEYGLQEDMQVVLVSGSRTSGGFGLMKPGLVETSPLGLPLRQCPGLADAASEGKLTEWNRRLYARVALHSGSFGLPAAAGPGYGYDLQAGDLLLVVRGSYVGPSFLSRGPLLAEARRHSELNVFE